MDLIYRFYHNQFSNLSPSILNKSELLETRIKSRAIAVAAIKTSASWMGVPLAFNLAWISQDFSIIYKSSKNNTG
jgi:hypothetical protein